LGDLPNLQVTHLKTFLISSWKRKSKSWKVMGDVQFFLRFSVAIQLMQKVLCFRFFKSIYHGFDRCFICGRTSWWELFLKHLDKTQISHFSTCLPIFSTGWFHKIYALAKSVNG
jgi:hypothetical protein